MAEVLLEGSDASFDALAGLRGSLDGRHGEEFDGDGVTVLECKVEGVG